MSAPNRLGRAFATVGGMTLLSRVLGFVRDMLIAGLLGAGPVAEAFFVAFRLPNMFRRFFAEGAFNAAFVPLFAKKLEGEGRDAAREFAEEALAGLALVLLILSALALALMPWLVFLLSPGFADDAGKFDLAVLFARIEFPYLFCMALTALFSGLLNALGRFAAPAAAPIVLNIILIGAMAGAAGLTLPVGHALAWGVFAAGLAQVALVSLVARREGIGLRLRRPRWTPGLRRLVQLGVPGALSGGSLQINLLIGTIIASWYQGAVAWLNYADRVHQLPLGIVGVAIGVVLLPELARRVRAGDETGARWTVNRAAEYALALTLPAAAGLIAMPFLITSALFERGAFTAADTETVGLALIFFALGLPAFVLQKVLTPVFFAREDMKSPLRYALAAMALNTAISLGGAPALDLFANQGWLAIPVGTSLGGWLNFWLLRRGARRFGDAAVIDARLRQKAPGMAIAAFGMAIAVAGAAWLLGEAGAAPGWRYLSVAGLVGLGLAVYLILTRLLGVFRITELAVLHRPPSGDGGPARG